MQNKKEIISYTVGIIVVILIIWVFASFTNNDTTTVVTDNSLTATSTVYEGDSPMDIFAKCLTGQDLTMYGAVWCSHCLNEKKAFGESFKYVQYVECPDNVELCTAKGINGYPTWIDGAGNKHEGEQGLVSLAKITGCELPNEVL